MTPTTIQIEVDEYMELFRSARTLYAMEAAGVDNWDGMNFIDYEQIDKECKEELEALDV